MTRHDLGGHVALVTGGSRGLGLAQAHALLLANATVVITGSQAAALDAAGMALREALGREVGERLHTRLHDIRDTEATSDLVAEIECSVGPIEYLINNAGVHLKKPIWDVETDEWRNIVDINLTGLFVMTREAVRRMKPRGRGSIVNISSMAGLMALPSAAGYVATKTAVIGLTRSVAVDCGPHGIRCNAVCPGFIDTDMTQRVLAGDPERSARIRGRIPSPRLGTPEDIAALVTHLCSDDAAYINGQTIAIDGGYSVGF